MGTYGVWRAGNWHWRKGRLRHLQVGSRVKHGDFPGGTVVKNLPANAGDTGLSPGPGRSHMPWSN